MEEELCGNNWDLDAVVRLGCCHRRISPASSQVDPFASFLLPLPPPTVMEVAEKELGVDAGWSFPNLTVQDSGGLGRDADELLKAFCAAFPSSSSLPTPPTPQPQPEQQQQKTVVVQENLPVPTTAAPASATARAQPAAVRQVPGGLPRSKRRKNQQKKVVRHVPADGVSADVWAWRKYGQKPIKGSPYPRGYYRCSSSKGCPARKQVERSRSDPSTFILTYTGEHNHSAPTHRNSLAGTTRNKLPSSTSSPPPQPPPPSVVVAGGAEAANHQNPPSTSPAGLSPTTPLRTPSMEEDEEEDDELLVEDMEMAGEDDLLFLNGGDDAAAALHSTPMSSLFDIDEPFLPSPWTEPTAAPAAAGS